MEHLKTEHVLWKVLITNISQKLKRSESEIFIYLTLPIRRITSAVDYAKVGMAPTWIRHENDTHIDREQWLRNSVFSEVRTCDLVLARIACKILTTDTSQKFKRLGNVRFIYLTSSS